VSRVLLQLAGALFLAASLAGCGSENSPPSPLTWTENGPTAVGDGCNPLAPEWDCLLPYPCDFFLKPTGDDGRGVVEVPNKALPVDVDGTVVDFGPLFAMSGFPVAQQIAVMIPGGVDPAQFIPYTGDIDKTATANGPTVLLEAATGAAVPHFAEIDPRPEKVDHRALVIRPLVRLEAGRRYVVALRGVKLGDGSLVQAPLGYAAIRDGGSAPGVDDRLRRYYDAWVWPALKKAQLPRDEAQLAWDFTTAFDASVRGDLEAMYSQVIPAVVAAPSKPKIAITSVSTGPKDAGPWRIDGTIEVPLFIDKIEQGGVIQRDAAGRPKLTGVSHPVPFAAYVPKTAFGTIAPPRVIIAGHGFFSSRKEVQGGTYAPMFEKLGAIGIGVDWWGLAQADRGSVAADLAVNMGGAGRLVDRVQQAMINASVLSVLAQKGRLSELLASEANGPAIKAPKKPELYYYGASLGHILGATFVGLNRYISRGVFAVGGANFGMIMPRSQPFGPLLHIVDIRMNHRLDSLKALMLLQGPLARIEPLFWARRTIAGTKETNTVTRPMLIQVGIGDASVPSLSAQLHARALGMGMDLPTKRKVWNLPAFDKSKHTSMYVEVDFQVPEPAVEAIPPTDDNEVHEGMRKVDAMITQMDAFLRPDGQLVHTCVGICEKGD